MTQHKQAAPEPRVDEQKQHPHIFRTFEPDAEQAECQIPEAVAEIPVKIWKPAGLCARLLFNCLLWVFYVIFSPLNDWLSRRRKRTEGPIKVLRLVSIITQGGVAKVSLQTMLRLPAEEVQTTLLVFVEKRASTQSLIEHGKIRLINRKLELWCGAYRFKLFRSLFKLAQIIRRENPDLIHVHEPQFTPVIRIAAGMAGGCKVIVHMHNDYQQRRRTLKDEQLPLILHSLRRSYLLACSQTIYEAAYGLVGKPAYPVKLIEDGTDDIPDRQPNPALREDLVRAVGGRRILTMMAHLMPHKRIEDFLMAGRILLDEGYDVYILLMAYGKPGNEERLREQFNELFKPHEGEFLYKVKAPQHLMDLVTIGVSTSSLEGLGLNILEYQIEGVPVVCTNLQPHQEMVTDEEDGLLFNVGDIAHLVRHLKRLLGDEALCKRLGEAGRQRAQKRTWSKTAQRSVAFYREVLDD